MARSYPVPRKQRTRQHVIADLSLKHIERFILDAGHTVQRLSPDYGYDLVLFTHDERGYAEPGVAFLQLKASETLTQVGAAYVFDLDIRDYNLWMVEDNPIFLILYDGHRRRAYWLYVQAYFRGNPSRGPKKGGEDDPSSYPAAASHHPPRDRQDTRVDAKSGPRNRDRE